MSVRRLVVTSFDPGVTCGWAMLRVPIPALLAKGQVGSTSLQTTTCGQFKCGSTSANVDRAIELLRLSYEEIAQEDDLFVVVQEGFTLRMLNSDPALMEPVRWLAVWDDRFAAPRPPFPFAVERQDPSEMGVITDSRLRLWGQWFEGREHGRAALKHNLVYLRRFVQSAEVRQRAGWKAEEDE